MAAQQIDENDLLLAFQTTVKNTFEREGTPENIKYTAEIAEQRSREMELITQYMMDGGMCPANIDVKEITTNLAKLDIPELEERRRVQFYSGDVMKAIACLANAIVLNLGPHSLASNDRIRDYFGSLHRIGDESASGFALSGTLATPEQQAGIDKPGEDLFVIKVPRDETSEAEIIHECIVAFKGTNQLRSEGIPNFAYIYGAFFCSPPVVSPRDFDNGKVLAFCNSKKILPSPYVIYENIKGTTYWDYCKKLLEEKSVFNPNFTDYSRQLIGGVQTVMDYYLQTLVALQCAYEKYNFTHYDLHGQNIIIRPVQETPFLIPYPTTLGTNGEKVYIYSPGGISTLIDYGRSHITTIDNGERKDYGDPSDNVRFGVFPDRAYPLSDAFKLFMTTLAVLTKKEYTEWFIKLSELLKQFEGIIEKKIADPIATFNRNYDRYSILPPEQIPSGRDLLWWIQVCRQWCRDNGLRDPIISEAERLGSGEYRSYDRLGIPRSGDSGCRLMREGPNFGCQEEEILRLARVVPKDPVPRARTFLEFYDLYGKFIDDITTNPRRMNQTQQDNYKWRLVSQFTEPSNFNQALFLERTKVSRLVAEIKQLYEILTTPVSDLHMTPLHSATDMFPDDLTRLFDLEYLERTKQNTARAVRYLDAYQRLETEAKVIHRIGTLLPQENPGIRVLLTQIDEITRIRNGSQPFRLFNSKNLTSQYAEYRQELRDAIRKNIEHLDPDNPLLTTEEALLLSSLMLLTDNDKEILTEFSKKLGCELPYNQQGPFARSVCQGINLLLKTNADFAPFRYYWSTYMNLFPLIAQ